MKYNVVFVLGADIDKKDNGEFILAYGCKDNIPLLGEWRMKAVKKLFTEKITRKFVIVSGFNTKFNVLKGDVMKHLLIKNYNIPEDTIETLRSEPHTAGNTAVIFKYLKDNGIDAVNCAFLTNFYHLPRSSQLFIKYGLYLKPLAAEAFFVLEESENILGDYGCGGTGFARRFVAELRGLYDLEFDQYQNQK